MTKGTFLFVDICSGLEKLRFEDVLQGFSLVLEDFLNFLISIKEVLQKKTSTSSYQALRDNPLTEKIVSTIQKNYKSKKKTIVQFLLFFDGDISQFYPTIEKFKEVKVLHEDLHKRIQLLLNQLQAEGISIVHEYLFVYVPTQQKTIEKVLDNKPNFLPQAVPINSKGLGDILKKIDKPEEKKIDVKPLKTKVHIKRSPKNEDRANRRDRSNSRSREASDKHTSNRRYIVIEDSPERVEKTDMNFQSAPVQDSNDLMKKSKELGWKKQASNMTNISAFNYLTQNLIEQTYPVNLAGMVLLNGAKFFLQNPSFQQSKL